MVIWSAPARLDLKSIYDYIAADSTFYASKVVQDIVEKSERLNDFPLAGRMVPEIENNNIREMIIYPYRLIYRVTPDQIEILALIHGKRDFSSSDIATSGLQP